MSCRDCKYFDQKGANAKGRAYGMCKAWDFSINENDGKNCKKFCTDGERADAPTCGEDFCEIGGDGE